MLDKVAILCFTAVHHAIDYKVFLKQKKQNVIVQFSKAGLHMKLSSMTFNLKLV